LDSIFIIRLAGNFGNRGTTVGLCYLVEAKLTLVKIELVLLI
jgi:hypothetical protein